MPISIQVDHRENSSGIPEFLAAHAGVSLDISSLPAGDYIINGVIGVERKSAEDLIQSIVSNRLFSQLARLKKSVARPLLIVEGNPYQANHAIHAHVIRGALLSVLLAWQIPIIFSKNKEDTVAILLLAARQEMSVSSLLHGPKNYRPQKIKGQRLFFLQNIPTVGPLIAGRLLKKFATLKGVINATEQELGQTEGIGKEKAKRIWEFFNGAK